MLDSFAIKVLNAETYFIIEYFLIINRQVWVCAPWKSQKLLTIIQSLLVFSALIEYANHEIVGCHLQSLRQYQLWGLTVNYVYKETTVLNILGY